MKKILLLTFSLFWSVQLLAQKKKSEVIKGEKNKQEQPQQPAMSLLELQSIIFSNALKYGDADAAKNALYTMIALRPELTELKDSLAILYYNMGNYLQAVLVAREIVAANPQNTTILEIKAISQQRLGLLKESLDDYEALYKQKQEVIYLYEIASLQYQLKRFGECDASIAAMLKSEVLDQKKITISLQRGESQEVNMRAAVLNMRGVLAAELNQKEVAKRNYEEALKIMPDFALAKANLNALTAEVSNNKTVSPSKK